jgi:hypothetical protein
MKVTTIADKKTADSYNRRSNNNNQKKNQQNEEEIFIF